jgi:glucokinase
MSTHLPDEPAVMTLDAGGTNFVFSAMQGRRAILDYFALPACGADLDRSLHTIIEGFRRVQAGAPARPAAISFAFPGPSDYPNGIISSPENLPAWRDVPLGPILEDTFGLPVFINNDGDLFAYGEATAGFLPYVNGLLENAGSPKQFHNLLAVTIGTGFGGGIVRHGELLLGDNSAGGEVWLLRNKIDRELNAEEGVSIRAVRRAYALLADLRLDEAPDPKTICEIAEGNSPGDRPAAREAFRRLGEIAGDAIAQATTLIDGLVVIGGGIAAAHRLFLPAIVAEMNSTYPMPQGGHLRRLVARAFDLEEACQLERFLQGDTREIAVPGSGRTIRYDAMQRVGVGISRLGTSEATAIGAYEFAVKRLGRR